MAVASLEKRFPRPISDLEALRMTCRVTLRSERSATCALHIGQCVSWWNHRATQMSW